VLPKEAARHQFIPAPRGEPLRSLVSKGGGLAAHPRLRGEPYAVGEPVEQVVGSSPPARGAHGNTF
jgi:hypothetical protein